MITGADLVASPQFLNALFASPGWLAWSSNILVIGLISLLVVVLLQMIGIAFNINSLRLWAKGEYMQVIVTFLLAGMLVALVGLTWSVMSGVVTQTYFSSPVLAQNARDAGIDPTDQKVTLDPFRFSQAFLVETMISCEQDIYRVLYSVNFYYKLVGSTKTETLGVEPLGGWYTTVYTSLFEYIIGHLNFLLLLHWIQIRLLSVMKYVAPLMFQIGLILRIFPMSRGAGGMLLAMGIGFFAVYPISLAMLMTLQPPGESFCTEFRAPPAMLDVSRGYDMVSLEGVQRASDALRARSGDVSSLIYKAKNFIPLFYLQAMFFPMVALIITFTFIRQTGAILGADLNEIGRGLVKLI